MTTLTIEVHGTPTPQGSKRAFTGKDGRAHVIESSHDRVKSWRGAVVDGALSAMPDSRPLSGPLRVTMVFRLARPRSHYRTGKNAHLLKDSAPVRPSGIPDLSKLARSTEDALTDAGAWEDDALVVSCTLAKFYCEPGTRPGASIQITELEPEPARAGARAELQEVT